jgi:hypothetical protein
MGANKVAFHEWNQPNSNSLNLMDECDPMN